VVRVLAVSDVVEDVFWADVTAAGGTQLVLACGDLPFDYLDHLMNALDVPLVFVPGNHDPEMGGYRTSRAGLTMRAGISTQPPWPDGACSADGRIVEVAGLRIAGLGGCLRYSDGPNQYSNRQQALRARRLAGRALLRPERAGRRVDVLLTHAPPSGIGDEPDAPHQGFTALARLVARLNPTLLLHGHVQPHARGCPDRRLGSTIVRNVTGRHLFDVEPAGLTGPVAADRANPGQHRGT
jgi:Icc-related predicted phosphoesterase